MNRPKKRERRDRGPPGRGKLGASALGNVVNLGRHRKRRARQAAQRQADANAVAHGRSKAERERAKVEAAQLRARVDGALRQRSEADAADHASTEETP